MFFLNVFLTDPPALLDWVKVGFLCTMVTLVTVLLWKGKIKSTAYTILLPAILVIFIVLLAFERLKEFDGKNLKLTLYEIQTIRREVYAKAEAVKEVAEEIANVATSTLETAISASTIDYVGPSIENLLKMKNSTSKMLRASGTEARLLVAKEENLNNLILRAFHVSGYFGLSRDANPKIDQILRESLLKNYDRSKLEKELRKEGFWKDSFTNIFDRIDRQQSTQSEKD